MSLQQPEGPVADEEVTGIRQCPMEHDALGPRLSGSRGLLPEPDGASAVAAAAGARSQSTTTRLRAQRHAIPRPTRGEYRQRGSTTTTRRRPARSTNRRPSPRRTPRTVGYPDTKRVGSSAKSGDCHRDERRLVRGQEAQDEHGSGSNDARQPRRRSSRRRAAPGGTPGGAAQVRLCLLPKRNAVRASTCWLTSIGIIRSPTSTMLARLY